MKKDVYTIYPDATLRDAAEMLLQYKISGLIVVDKKGTVVGVLSEKDIYRALYPSYRDFYEHPELFTDFKKQEEDIHESFHTPVKDIMSKEVISIDPEDYIMKVGAIMLARNIHRIPVIDKNGKLVGVISRGHIYRTLFKKQLRIGNN